MFIFSKKAKVLNYLNTNTLSPQNNYLFSVNNKENDNVSPKLHNIPGSVQRSFKYKNCYILNNLNNYQPNVIIGNKTKPNKYTNILINKNNEILIDNTIDMANKKINSFSPINNNIISNSNNNTLLKSPINCLNTITFNINNNYNNCCNNYIKENNSENDLGKFDCFKINGLGSLNNKSLSNLNEISGFNSREKILKKLTEENEHLDININPIKNQNNNKRSTLFKAKSKTKIKSSQYIYSNTTNSNTNNTKKSNKSSINNTNSLNNNNTSNINNKINGEINNKYDSIDNINNLNENDKIKIYLETNSNNNTNSLNNINNKDLLYEAVHDKYNDEYLNYNNINNNILNSNNKRNYENNFKEYEFIKPINTMNCYQRKINDNNNLIADKNLENKEQNNINAAFQTYSGPFRNNLIKVNMLEKDNKNIENENINRDINEDDIEILNSNKKQKIFNKNNNNKNSNIIKNEKKNLYIQTDFKGNKKYKKSNNKFSFNNKIYNNEKFKSKNRINLIQNYYEEKEKDKNLGKQNENEEINGVNNKSNEEKKKIEEGIKNNGKLKEKGLESAYKSKIISNYCKLYKNSSLSNITSNLNLNNFPLSRDRSTAYIKKKSSNMNLQNNGCENFPGTTNRASYFKKKKNYSISQSCFNTQRNSNDIKIKNKINNKSNYLYSPKNTKIEKKTFAFPEYKVKLENLKSRITNLLNVYSLLALKNINISTNINNINKENEKEVIISNNSDIY